MQITASAPRAAAAASHACATPNAESRPVSAQIPQRGVESGVEQDRRHEQSEREVGRQGESGDAGHQRQPGPAHRKHRRVGEPEPRRCQAEQHGPEQDDENEFEGGDR